MNDIEKRAKRKQDAVNTMEVAMGYARICHIRERHQYVASLLSSKSADLVAIGRALNDTSAEYAEAKNAQDIVTKCIVAIANDVELVSPDGGSYRDMIAQRISEMELVDKKEPEP